jgi:hypothetical protein
MQERKEIQKCFYDFVALYIIQILFFDWFYACPITFRNKTPI